MNFERNGKHDFENVNKKFHIHGYCLFHWHWHNNLKQFNGKLIKLLKKKSRMKMVAKMHLN